MLKRFFIVLILLVLLVACQPETPLANPTLTVTSNPTAETTPGVTLSDIASGSNEPLTVENINYLEQLVTFGNGHIQDVTVSPDQSFVAVYVGQRIDLYDTETLNLQQSIVVPEYKKYNSDISRSGWKTLTITSDSKILVFSDGQSIILWDVAKNKKMTSFASLIQEMDVVDIALSPMENHVMVSSLGGSFRCDGREINFALYDLDGKLIYDHSSCFDYLRNFHYFTNDGKVLLIFASVMTSIYPSETFLIDEITGKVLEHTEAEYLDYEHPTPNLKLLYDISPDGNLLAYAVYNKVNENISVRTKIVNTETKALVDEQEGLVEFFTDQDKISWKTFSLYETSTEPDADVCNINEVHQFDTYKLLSSKSEKAVYAVMHSSQIESIELWDISNCQMENAVSYPAATQVLFSPDSRWLASSDSYHAHVWDAKSGELHFMVNGKAFDSPENVIQFNADSSRFLASSFGYDYVYPDQPYRNYIVSVFDTQTGQLIRELKPDGEFLKNIIATPEKDLVIIQDSDNMQVWNIETGQKLASLPVGTYVFAPQSGYIWIVPSLQNNYKTTHKINLYNYHTGKLVRELAQVTTWWVRGLYLDSSGTKLLAHLFLGQGKENGDKVIIFDTENNGKELLSYKLPWMDFEMSVYGDTFATNDSDGEIHFWNFESDVPLSTIEETDLAWVDTLFLNENILLTKEKKLHFWNVQNGHLLAELNFDYYIKSLCISPDGTQIAVVCEDGVITLWGVSNKPSSVKLH